MNQCNIFINLAKLSKTNKGNEIAIILRELADSFEGNSHFNPDNLINNEWGCCPLVFKGKNIGGMELINSIPY